MHVFDNNLFESLENILLLLLYYYFVVAAIIISDTRFISRQPKVAAAAIKFRLLSRLVCQTICYFKRKNLFLQQDRSSSLHFDKNIE